MDRPEEDAKSQQSLGNEAKNSNWQQRQRTHLPFPHSLFDPRRSGKTLAFLVPLLEKLYRRRYTPADGPGAVVLSPTRELAVQTFQVLRSIGMYHNFSAGLLVGGELACRFLNRSCRTAAENIRKNRSDFQQCFLRFDQLRTGKKEFGLEQRHVPRMNIVVATPGRLLQHLEQTSGFEVDRVCLLVLDEADRILDLGFREQMVRILDYLPPGNAGEETNDDDDSGRQTMLFSATQTKRVADLAALSLHKPEYLGVHDKETSRTPRNLEQSVMTVPLEHKLNMVYSFIKSHLRCKTIVFFSSCSQVRHAWQVFCTLQPGVPLMALHGKLKQETRTKLYFDFLQRPHAVLFATDVASRGLDFPNVDWVVQADAPEDVEMYIHRVGRTARYKSGGKALMIVLPQEEKGMAKLLDGAKIKVKTASMNPNKAVNVTKKAASVVAASPDMNLLAKKAFKSYLRSVHLMPNKDVFGSVTDLPLEEYASSLGLAGMPTVRFLKKLTNREEQRKKKNVDYKLLQLKEEIKRERLEKKIAELGGSDSKAAKKILDKSKKKDKKRRRNEDDSDDDGGEDADDGLLVVKKVHEWGDRSQAEDLPEVDLHRASKSRHSKKIRIDGSSSGANQKIRFDDDGDEEEATVRDAAAGDDGAGDPPADLAAAREEYLERVRGRLSRTREQDRREERTRVQDKHKKRRLRERGDAGGDGAAGEAVVTLGGGDESSDEGSDGGPSSGDESGRDRAEADLYESSGDEDEDDDEVDVKAQEEIALAMLGN